MFPCVSSLSLVVLAAPVARGCNPSSRLPKFAASLAPQSSKRS